ncbi:glycine zipper domain-containing protein [Prevotella conceptionensis]|jgi:hypothetical protein|uniref:glycine zipper domain-containing protein n=1 Tax=Prevotella conceptionensis TaxID=340486 RepID=UPI000313B51F|nr:glycine zipper domain-containing protein [Prevotella conceptionensis]
MVARKLIMALIALAMLVGCGTYAGSGAYAGATLGSILGSAIGGITGGARGSDLGQIVGTGVGAAIGAAIGEQADKKAEERSEKRRERIEQRRREMEREDYGYNNEEPAYGQYPPSDSGFDENNGGDDRIFDFKGSDYTGNYSAQQPSAGESVQQEPTRTIGTLPIEIRNARFVDDNQNRQINRDELCKVIFELWNNSSQTLHDVQPIVTEETDNKHLAISPTIHVEQLEPGKAIRYTALVRADRKLKPGNAVIRVAAVRGNNIPISEPLFFNIPTDK